MVKCMIFGDTKSSNSISSWFQDYIKSFHPKSADQIDAFQIKITHSYNVKKIMHELASGLNWSENDIEIAEVIGLLHDVARFPQYHHFQTFHDKKSFDHGDYAEKIIREHQILTNFSSTEQSIILSSVKNHNKKMLAISSNTEALKFAKLIRDADKLDIYRFVCPLYENDPPDLAECIKLSWPHKPKITQAIVKLFLNEKTIDFSYIKYVNDFKIAQLAWIFDINYDISLKWLIKNKFPSIIINSLPDIRIQKNLFHKLEHYFSLST